MDVRVSTFVVCCVDSGLCDGLITRLEDSFSARAGGFVCLSVCVCVCVGGGGLIVCDSETSKRGGKAGFCAAGLGNNKCTCPVV